MRRALLTFVLVLAPAAAQDHAQNVILFIADAAGIPTLNAASLLGYNAPQQLFVQNWPHIALSDTSTASQWVSDSAAGMTAIVTGRKTHNGVVSQGPGAVRGERDGAPLKTILEYAEEHGLATGVDILLGPGRSRIAREIQVAGQDLDALARDRHRPLYSNLADVPAKASRALAVVEETADEFDLDAAVRVALDGLASDPDGFFLMVESDAHTADLEAGLNRLIRFDKLIREIAGTVNLEETLLIFTADHSFNLRVHDGGPGEPLLKGLAEWTPSGDEDETVRLPFVRVDDDHTGEEVPVAAIGPGSERVRGFLPNTEIFRIMMAAYGWEQSE